MSGGVPLTGKEQNIQELLRRIAELEDIVSQSALAAKEILLDDEKIISMVDEIVFQFLNLKVAIENKDSEQAKNGTGPYLQAIYKGIDKYICWKRSKIKEQEENTIKDMKGMG